MNFNFLSPQKLGDIRNEKVYPFLSGDILDLGCGWGFVPAYLKKNQKINNYVGVDCYKKNLDTLVKQFPEYDFIHHNLDDYLFVQQHKFDTVVSVAVIEHIYNQKNFFLTATKNLKIGGKLVLTTPSIFGNDIIYPLMCKFGMRTGNGVLDDHITIYNKRRFSVVANDFGMVITHYSFFEFFCNQLVVFEKIEELI